MYLSLQVFIAAGILLLLLRAKLKAFDTVGNAPSARVRARISSKPTND